MEERRAVLTQLLTECKYARGIPAAGRQRSTHGLQSAVRQPAHGLRTQELLEDRRHEPALTAIAFGEPREGPLPATQRKYRGMAGLVLERHIIPPAREHPFGALASAVVDRIRRTRCEDVRH